MKEDLKLLARVKIANPTYLSKFEEIDLIIDTGATFSVIKKTRLQRLGIPVIGKKKLRLANGDIIEREYGGACFIIEEAAGVSDVIFGEENDTELLGLLSLEGMALTIDTQSGKLTPIEILLL